MRPLEVFLSHSSADHAYAERIAACLGEHGVPTFFAPEDLLGAQQWQSEILSALRRCDWFVVLLSPTAVESMWVERETSWALSDPRYRDKIVPLLKTDCDLGSLDWLRLFQRVDFRGDFDQGMRELLKIWGIGMKAMP
jgi:hypothetical protein